MFYAVKVHRCTNSVVHCCTPLNKKIDSLKYIIVLILGMTKTHTKHCAVCPRVFEDPARHIVMSAYSMHLEQHIENDYVRKDMDYILAEQDRVSGVNQ